MQILDRGSAKGGPSRAKVRRMRPALTGGAGKRSLVWTWDTVAPRGHTAAAPATGARRREKRAADTGARRKHAKAWGGSYCELSARELHCLARGRDRRGFLCAPGRRCPGSSGDCRLSSTLQRPHHPTLRPCPYTPASPSSLPPPKHPESLQTQPPANQLFKPRSSGARTAAGARDGAQILQGKQGRW